MYSQEQLNQLSYTVCTKLDDLLDHFNIKESCKKAQRFYVGPCPVHGGDKGNAFNLYHSGQIIGNWKCYTHQCHQHFQPTIIGFTRGLLSHRHYGWKSPRESSKEYGFSDTIKFLTDFTNCKLSDIKPNFEYEEKQRFVRQMESIYLKDGDYQQNLCLDPKLVLSSLKIPAEYFIYENYSKEVLCRYDVGLCDSPGKEMFMRAVVPIYNDDHTKIIGCTGRSIFKNACVLCDSWHAPSTPCPDDKNKWKYSKWRHNYGFKSTEALYNYWFAAPHIRKDGIAIIVESPGNVWRLEEAGIPYSVGIFGSKLSETQKIILDKSGAMSLIVLTDPDKAGTLAEEDIIARCKNSYNIYTPKFYSDDIGATPISVLQDKLQPLIDKIKNA